MKTKIVLGLQFGDEGKGKAVNFLSNEDSLVVRFNGGPQAGHTVTHNGIRHVFSSFGSATLKGTPTYWSKFCPFSPTAMLREAAKLAEKGITEPKLYIDPLCPIITPFDVAANKTDKLNMKHGTCGHGVGKTIEKHEKSPFRIFAIDLLCPTLLEFKLQQLYLGYYSNNYHDQAKMIPQFLEECQLALQVIEVKDELKDFRKYNSLIFEGAQGILLDQDHGFFPFVTRSSTTSKNAIQLLKDYRIHTNPEIYYCVRSYLTRHGNGPVPNWIPVNFPDETNITNPFQGEFRQGYHSKSLLDHALRIDDIYNNVPNNNYLRLLISHLDQTDDKFLVNGTQNNNLGTIFPIQTYASGIDELKLL